MTDEQFHDPIWGQLKQELQELVNLRSVATEVLRLAVTPDVESSQRPSRQQLSAAKTVLEYATKAESHLGYIHRLEHIARQIAAMENARGKYRQQVSPEGTGDAVSRLGNAHVASPEPDRDGT